MPSPDLIDPRYDDLVRELRATRPLATPELRGRVRAVAEREPEPEVPPRFALPRVSLRRTALVLAPAAVAVLVGVAVVHGLLTSGSSPKSAAPAGRTFTQPSVLGGQNPTAEPPHAPQDQAFAPELRRLQRYDATMRVRVRNLDGLSRATRDAVRATRRLGGYVAVVDFNSPTVRRGDAHVVARVPVGRVQDAIARFEGLGTIVAQHVHVLDVQRTVDEQAQAIRALRSEIARVRRELAGAQTPSERARLQAKLDSDLRRLRSLVRSRNATIMRAQFAKIDLTLTTRAIAKPPPHRGRLDRTLRDAGSVLAREGEILLYALIVIGPLLLLGGAAVAVARARARRDAERLLGV